MFGMVLAPYSHRTSGDSTGRSNEGKGLVLDMPQCECWYCALLCLNALAASIAVQLCLLRQPMWTFRL